MTVLAENLTTADAGRRSLFRGASAARVVLILAVAWLVAILACVLVPNVIAPGDPLQIQPDRILQAPGATLLGTDQFGRSVFELLVHGARISIFIGLAATVLSLIIGGSIGMIAGYWGGRLDMVIGRLIDILMCFPGILLALVIAAALGPSVRNIIIAVGVGNIPSFARVMRSQVISVRSRLFIEAARATGLSHGRILRTHILPNSLAPIIVLATIEIGSSIVAAAALSFLGAGASSGIPDWGTTIARGQPFLNVAWWITTISGVILTLTVIALSILGDWLRDRLDTE
ncbi:ABC transporter permease [Ornithinimicrobium pratense]|nr:ABC transporter permease [Ornithinimicrobium pratense]